MQATVSFMLSRVDCTFIRRNLQPDDYTLCNTRELFLRLQQSEIFIQELRWHSFSLLRNWIYVAKTFIISKVSSLHPFLKMKTFLLFHLLSSASSLNLWRWKKKAISSCRNSREKKKKTMYRLRLIPKIWIQTCVLGIRRWITKKKKARFL